MAAPRIEFRSNIGRDLFGILFLKSFAVASVRKGEHSAGCDVALGRIERRESRSVNCRLRRKPGLKDLICPIAQPRYRAKVQSERHDTPNCRIAEAPTDDVVDVDVSWPKAKSGLLRAPNAKRPAKRRRWPPPVRRPYMF